MRLFTIGYLLFVSISSVQAAFVTPRMGGGQSLAPMKHADISFSSNAIGVQIDNSVGIPMLTPLEEPDEFNPAENWGVLGTKAYNFQYGWNPSGFIIPPVGGWIWIEQLSATPGLEVYQRPPASPAYAPIFGTEGTSLRWRWNGSMTHNVYAVQDPIMSLYEAEYRVYIGNDFTGEPLAGYASADVTFQFSTIPVLLADFDEDNDVDGQDLLQWEGDFAQNGDSDADGDGDSDGADFLIWQLQMGSQGSPAFATVLVPEPSSIVLLLTMLTCVLALKRH